MSTFGSSQTSLSMDVIANKIAPAMKNTETRMMGLLESLGPHASAGDLLQAQTTITQWTLKANLQSALVKEIGDALKGIIQKSG